MNIISNALSTKMMTLRINRTSFFLRFNMLVNLKKFTVDREKNYRKSILKTVAEITITVISIMITPSVYGQNSIILKCHFNQVTKYRQYKSDYFIESVTKFTSTTYRLQYPRNISVLEVDGISWSDNICKTGYCLINSNNINRTDKQSNIITLGKIQNVQMHTDLSWSINRATGSYMFSRVNVFELPNRNGETIIQKEEGRGACYETAASTVHKVE